MPRLTFGIYDNGAETDAPFGNLKISGQDEYGFRPYYLMSSAVVGCAAGVLRRELSARGVKYDDIKVVADVTRNLAIANRIEEIDLEFQIKLTSDAPNQQIEDAMQAMLSTSSMVQTVKESIKVKSRFTIVPA